MPRLAIELVTVCALVFVLQSVLYDRMRPFVVRAAVIEAKTLARGIRLDETLYFAEHGSWPGADLVDARPYDPYSKPKAVAKLEPGAGWVHVRLSSAYPELAGKTISFRAAVSADAPDAPVDWLCGHSKPLPGYVPLGEDRTDVPTIYLGKDCGG